VARCFGIYRGRDVIRADPERDTEYILTHVTGDDGDVLRER
jgi:hypothetical protein